METLPRKPLFQENLTTVFYIKFPVSRAVRITHIVGQGLAPAARYGRFSRRGQAPALQQTKFQFAARAALFDSRGQQGASSGLILSASRKAAI